MHIIWYFIYSTVYMIHEACAKELQHAGRRGFSCREMSAQHNFRLSGELSENLLTPGHMASNKNKFIINGNCVCLFGYFLTPH
jgi:hypothetical protein